MTLIGSHFSGTYKVHKHLLTPHPAHPTTRPACDPSLLHTYVLYWQTELNSYYYFWKKSPVGLSSRAHRRQMKPRHIRMWKQMAKVTPPPPEREISELPTPPYPRGVTFCFEILSQVDTYICTYVCTYVCHIYYG